MNKIAGIVLSFAVCCIVLVAEAGFRSSSQGTGTSYVPPAGPTLNPLADNDSDGIPNSSDPDDDNDGFLDTADAFPLDATEWVDTDSDLIGNNADTDDDGDGIPDLADAFPLDSTQSIAALDASTLTTQCSENLCIVRGTASTGTTSVTVTGTHATATNEIRNASPLASGDNFELRFENLTSGAWTFQVTATNASGQTVLASAPQGSSASLAQAIADAIADPANPVTVTDVQNSSLPAQLQGDLLAGTSCGADGSRDCLAWFNDLTATTTCARVTGASSNAEVETYTNCVLHEGYVALIDSAVVPTPESIVGGCSDPDPVVFGLPRLCNLSQISCTVDGVPSSWTVNAAETSLTVPVSYISGVSGSEAINATVGLTLAPRYNTNGYSYRIPQTYNVIPSQAGVDAQGRLLRVVNSGRANPMSAQQTCRNLGGELASKAQADAFTTNTGTYAWLMYHPTGNDENLSWGTAGTCSYRNSGDDRCVARDGAYGAQATDCGYMVRETRPHPQYGAWGVTVQVDVRYYGFFWDREQRVTQQYCSTSGAVGWNDSIAFVCKDLPRCE